jgi:hypothetical protein
MRKIKLFLLMSLLFAAACKKDNNSYDNSTNVLLQHKWTLISRTATFPASPRNNFVETDSPNDYFTFGKNDTAYSYVTLYAPFSIDTVYYKASPTSITFYVNQNQNGWLFQSQDTSGHWHDTTVAQILTLTDNSLVLSFPAIGTVTNLAGPGITTYYPGTEIDSFKR